jgi:hypothetical protein
MSAERREYRRYDLRLSAEISIGDRQFTAVTRDVSAGGCCLESAYKLEENANIDLALFLVIDGIEDTSMPPLRVPAHVQWAAENEEAPAESRHLTGIRFEGATQEQISWLEGVLARMS